MIAGALVAALSWSAAAQTFDLYPAEVRAPLVIFVHGGAWVGGDKGRYRALGEAFARHGVCAAVIGYHLAPAFVHPRPVDDLEAARVDLVKRAHPKCDADRVVLIGHSAGAHAIAFWATRAGAARVRGFVGLEGIYDLVALTERYPDYGPQFVGPEFGPASAWAAASPSGLKPRVRAPWLLVHSRADELVDHAQSTAFAAHLRTDGIAVERYEPANDTHFGVVQSLSAPKSTARDRILAFVRRVTR